MPGPVKRFAFEAAFLILVAIGAGVADMTWPLIILVMGLGWLLVALVERTASREAARLRAEPAGAEDAAEAEAGPAVTAPAVEPSSVPPAVEVEQGPVALERPPHPAEQEPAPAQLEPPPAEHVPEAAPLPEPAAPADGASPPAPKPAVPPVEPEPKETEAAPEEHEEAEAVGLPAAEAPERAAVAEVDERPRLAPVPGPKTPLETAGPAPSRPADEVAEDRGAVVELLPRAEGPRQWNVWHLERLVRERAGEDASRDEELAALLMYLREFANADGALPVDFDALVRESFAALIAGGGR